MVHIVTRVGDVRRKVSTCGNRPRGIGRQFGAPDGALVTEKCAYPVSGPLSQHRISIFTARDEQELAVFLQRTERKMYNGAGVSFENLGIKAGMSQLVHTRRYERRRLGSEGH